VGAGKKCYFDVYQLIIDPKAAALSALDEENAARRGVGGWVRRYLERALSIN
jgi:hypothetical protein